MSEVFTKTMPKQPVTLAKPKSVSTGSSKGGPTGVKAVPLSTGSVFKSVGRGCCGAKQR